MEKDIERLIDSYLDYRNLEEIGDEYAIREEIDTHSLAVEIVNFLQRETSRFIPQYQVIEGSYQPHCRKCGRKFGIFQTNNGHQISFKEALERQILFLP
jgi:hypothetical protein